MILDSLERSSRYATIFKSLAKAFEFLSSTDPGKHPVGRMELEGSHLYALVQEYTTKPPEEGRWEAHRRYIDVQYIVSGRERIGYAPIERLQAGEYDAEKDFLPLSGEGMVLEVCAGFFAVFFPEDAHMPGLMVEQPELVRKVVVKVPVWEDM